jgi:uncharacterized repeat protein (TIGR01451 family)
MRILFCFRACAVVFFAIGTCGERVHAQSPILNVTSSANSVLVSNAVTFSINVTNQTGASLTDVTVTHSVSSFVNLLSATSSIGTGTNTTTNYLFSLGTLTNGSSAQMTLTVAPTVAGNLVNRFTVRNATFTNIAETNITVLVTNLQTDLAVSIVPPAFNVLVGDRTTYTVNVTNLGPNTVSGVVLTNTGSAGLRLIGLSPTNFTGVFTNGALLLNMGTMASGAFEHIKLIVQPTNAGPAILLAGVGSPGLSDLNVSNNTAGVSFTVDDYLPAELVVSLVSTTQVFNPSTGLMEQTIRITNTGTNDAPSLRVTVTNLPYALFNAVGTNSANGSTNGLPFVIHAAPLTRSNSVDLVIEYFVPNGLPFAISSNQFLARAVPLVNFSLAGLGTQVVFTRAPIQMPSGAMLVEFASIPGRNYAIVYSEDVSFSNPKLAPPSISASASRKQWIDYGPPKTVSSPVNGGTRYYKVFLNPQD